MSNGSFATRSADSGPARVNVLGVGISPLNRVLAAQAVLEALGQRQRGYICVTGVHGVMECQADTRLRAIHNQAWMCTPDGMPMVWMGKFQGVRHMGRVYGPDLMLDVCEGSVAQGYRHYLYGGANGVARALQAKLEARFPGLQIVGTFEPPFRPLNPEEQVQLIQDVARCRPDMFWVGLSTPKQERFMAEYLPRLDVSLMAGVGAAFDFHAGRMPQAPSWMQRTGLEWFYRLCKEPRRLWKRYLTNNPRFVWRVALQCCGLRRYELN